MILCNHVVADEMLFGVKRSMDMYFPFPIVELLDVYSVVHCKMVDSSQGHPLARRVATQLIYNHHQLPLDKSIHFILTRASVCTAPP
jgi:hypothetical protein